MTWAPLAHFHGNAGRFGVGGSRLVMTKVTIRLDFTDTASIGPGKVRLLEAVETTGSIRKAAASTGMSFRQAWLLLQALDGMFGQAVIETVRGGAQGGGTRLTSLGQSVVAHYRRAECAAGRAADADFQALAAKVRHTSAAGVDAASRTKSVRGRKSLKKRENSKKTR